MDATENRSFWIVDSTLRDGEQAPGVVFTLAEKLAIARLLAEAGVVEIEAGTPAMGEDEVHSIQAIVRLQLPVRLTAWCRALESDVVAAARCGVSAVHISLPVSSIHLRNLRKSKAWVLEQIEAMVEFSRRHFDFISVGTQDASRADPSFLFRCAKLAARLRVDRFRIADTVGVWTPFGVHAMLSQIRRTLPDLNLGFHGHNDLGMATANTIAAVMAGAKSADITVNGLGERAGNAALEEVVMALQVALGRTCGVDPRYLSELSHTVARAAARPIPDSKPITGAATFQHESGIHVEAILTDPRTYEPFPPETIGHSPRELILGKHSGRASVLHAMRREGISLEKEEATAFLVQLRRHSQRTKSAILPHRLAEILSLSANTNPSEM